MIALGKEIPYLGLMITSRLTSKAQTTIPQPVRIALQLREGDELAYTIEDGRVILSKALPTPDDPFAVFDETIEAKDADPIGKVTSQTLRHVQLAVLRQLGLQSIA